MRSKLTTIILIGMVLGILDGYACHTLWPDPKTAKTIADYISLITDIFPAPDQNDHRTAGILNACGRRSTHGRYQSYRPYRREGYDLVRRGVACVADAGHDPSQHPAAW